MPWNTLHQLQIGPFPPVRKMSPVQSAPALHRERKTVNGHTVLDFKENSMVISIL